MLSERILERRQEENQGGWGFGGLGRKWIWEEGVVSVVYGVDEDWKVNFGDIDEISFGGGWG